MQDFNNDGVISLDEMTEYLTNVFKVVYESEPHAAKASGVSPEELAVATAKTVFDEADLDRNSMLSKEEFMAWFSQRESSVAESTVKGAPHIMSLAEVRRVSHLDSYPSDQVFEALLAETDDFGRLTLEAFVTAFTTIFSWSGTELSAHPRAVKMLRVLFSIFDEDKNGFVDYQELLSAVSVLCKGSRLDKVRSAFSLIDENGDGFISFDEMLKYLKGIFTLLYKTVSGTEQRVGVSSQGLAEATTEQCFLDCDLNKDGKLNYDEFSRWFSNFPDALQV